MYKKGEDRHYRNRRSRTASFKKVWFNVMIKGRRSQNRATLPTGTERRRSFFQRHLAPHRFHLSRQRHPSRRPSGLDRCLARWFTAVRSLSHFWATHVLLLIFLGVYTVGGAYIFVQLEQETESKLLTNWSVIRINVWNQLWKECTQANEVGQDAWKKGFKTIVWGHREMLCAADAWMEIDPKEAGTHNAWTFPNAMLFCSTVFTTIGYGNVTPKTTGGQLFTIAYALVGIPYWLAVLADIGQVMRGILRRLYILSYKFYYLGRCFHWQFTPPTVVVNRFFASTPFFVTTEENEISPPVDSIDTQGTSFSSVRVGNDSLFLLSGFHESDFVVPVWVGCALLSIYVFAGAVLFSSYEAWNFVESLYFIFVSLTTIGFGDFFPEKISLWIVFCYIMVGLALVSLFFNLLIEYLQSIMKKAQRKITRAWAARISVVEEGAGPSPEEDLSPRYSGSLLDVHIVESLPFTLVTSRGFLRRDGSSRTSSVGNERHASLSVAGGLHRKSSAQQPIVLVQISDSRLLDYTRSKESRRLSDEDALVRAARDAVFGASRAQSVLTPSSSSPPSSPHPKASNQLHISEGSLLEYMQERVSLARGSRSIQQRGSQTQPPTPRRGSTSPSLRTSSNLSFMRRSSSQNMPSPRHSRILPMTPRQRRSSASQEFQSASTSQVEVELPAWVPLRPLQEGVQMDHVEESGGRNEIPVYSPLRRYVPSHSQPLRKSTGKAASFVDIPETPIPNPTLSQRVISRLLSQTKMSSSESDPSDDGSPLNLSTRRKKGKRKHQTLPPHLQPSVHDSSTSSTPSPHSPSAPLPSSSVLRSPRSLRGKVSRPTSTRSRAHVPSRSPQETSPARSPITQDRPLSPQSLSSIGATNTPTPEPSQQPLQIEQQDLPQSPQRRIRTRSPQSLPPQSHSPPSPPSRVSSPPP